MYENKVRIFVLVWGGGEREGKLLGEILLYYVIGDVLDVELNVTLS